MACEGSVNMIDTLPDHDPESSGQNIAARQGKCAHEVAERALNFFAGYGNRIVDAAYFIGSKFHDVDVTEEMAAHVQLYLDHVRKVMTIPGVVYWIEKKFSLALLNPPTERPMFGTSDFSAYDPATRTLYVDDLKYGQVPVEIEGNPQVKYYALGVWLSLDGKTQPVDEIVLTIIQPRRDHPAGVIRSVTITLDELVAFGNDLIAAAYATLPKDAALHAGDHCKWCPAKARCPELQRLSQEIAATEFDEVPIVPPPALIPREQFAEMLGKLHILDDWSASMKEHAYNELLAGREVPGFKLVERRAERKWLEDVDKRVVFPDDSFESKLKSPAQIEKIVGKKKFKETLAQHTVKKSSGLKLVPEDHPSPPVLTGGAEFDMLPAPDSDNEGQDTENNEK
jgi:hypothetical protein